MDVFASHQAPKCCITYERRPLLRFCSLPSDALADYNRIGVMSCVLRGTRIFAQGDRASNVYVLCLGKVKIFSDSREGKTLILRIASPGDLMGLSSVLADAPHEATAEAIEPCQVKTIGRQEFLDFLWRHGIASLHAARSLSDEYHQALRDTQRLALPRTAAGKLAHLLLDWGRKAAHGGPELCFTMALTHEEVANMTGVSRETVTRVLSQFRRDRLIIVHGTRLTIAKPDELERLSA